MSIENLDISDEEFERAINGSPPSPDSDDRDVFDLGSLGKQMVRELVSYKKRRDDMLASKKQIETQINILNKRIEIVLSAIKTLQTPV